MLGSAYLSLEIIYLELEGVREREDGQMNIPLLASLNTFLIACGMFYWMRMFNSVSMYFRIVLDSVFAAKYFIFMVGILIGAFGCAVYVLDQI